MKKNVNSIEGLCVITPAVHGDARGYFTETYNKNDMEEAGIFIDFVQDNQSASVKGVLRGLHRQKIIRKQNLFVVFQVRYMMLPLICVQAAKLMANGLE